MDIVYIRDLRINTIIGIYDWERQIKQTLRFDVEMATDIRQAAAHDDIEFALNYKLVSDRIIEFVEGCHAKLIETIAEGVAQLVMSEFQVPWLRLQVSKAGAVRDAQDVGLIIERGKKTDKEQSL